MRVGAVSGESEPLSILLFGLWNSGGSAQVFFCGAKSKLRGGLQDAATIWWARLARGPDDGSVALLKFRIVILITVKRGPNLDQKIFAS